MKYIGRMWCSTHRLKPIFICFLIISIIYLFGFIAVYRMNMSMLFNKNNTRFLSFKKSDLPHSTQRLYMVPLQNATKTFFDDDLDTDTIIYEENATFIDNLCPMFPPNLTGRVEVIQSPIPTIRQLNDRFIWLQPGGHYAPSDCVARHKVGIIIPYRARAHQLLLLLQHIHPFLKKQQIDYTIFVVEQYGTYTFNKGMMMNIGYVEALKVDDFQCFIFHDVDLLPEDDRILYTCPEQPRHLSRGVSTFNYKLPYRILFGGVTAISTNDFKKVNGYSNSFWGWGGEDDDMTYRLAYYGLNITRYPKAIARYTMIVHKKERINPNRYAALAKKQYDTDGLSDLKYEIVQYKINQLYTYILAKIDTPS